MPTKSRVNIAQLFELYIIQQKSGKRDGVDRVIAK